MGWEDVQGVLITMAGKEMNVIHGAETSIETEVGTTRMCYHYLGAGHELCRLVRGAHGSSCMEMMLQSEDMINRDGACCLDL